MARQCFLYRKQMAQVFFLSLFYLRRRALEGKRKSFDQLLLCFHFPHSIIFSVVFHVISYFKGSLPVIHFASKMKIWKTKSFWLQGGSNSWPYDYWLDALTSWAMFFSKPNNFHQAVNYSLHRTNKNRYPRSMRPFFGMGKIALYNEHFLLRIIGLCWPIFQWSHFFFPQCSTFVQWIISKIWFYLKLMKMAYILSQWSKF